MRKPLLHTANVKAHALYSLGSVAQDPVTLALHTTLTVLKVCYPNPQQIRKFYRMGELLRGSSLISVRNHN